MFHYVSMHFYPIHFSKKLVHIIYVYNVYSKDCRYDYLPLKQKIQVYLNRQREHFTSANINHNTVTNKVYVMFNLSIDNILNYEYCFIFYTYLLCSMSNNI